MTQIIVPCRAVPCRRMGALSFLCQKFFFAKYQKLIIIAKAVVVRVLKKRKKMESQKYTLRITCYSDTLVAELNDGDGVILKTTCAIAGGIDIQKLEEKIFLEIENLFQELNVKYDLTKKESHSDLGPITYPWGD
ncbi:MAG: hypothetical protein ACK5O9_06260 [Holosporales bacterium]